MKLSLRSARKLDSKIRNRVNDVSLSSAVNAEVNIYADRLPGVLLHSAQQNLETSLNTNISLMSVRSDVRRLIQIQNEASGINQLISDRKKLCDELVVLEMILDMKPSTIINSDILGGKIKAKATAAELGKTGYGSSDTISINVLTSELLETIKTNTKIIQLEIDKVDDGILELNMTTKVELSSVAVSMLQTEGLL